MSESREITCINKGDRYNAHERILHVGGVISAVRWKLSQTDAIAAMESGRASFYVTRGGSTVNVLVAQSPYGHKYLKTEADGEQPDNLLSLPECP